MSEQEDRPKKKVANYSSTRSPTTQRNKFKFNPIEKKNNNNKNIGKNTTENSSVSQGETQSESFNTRRNNTQLKETTWKDENILKDEQNIINLEEDNFNNNSNIVTNWKGKQKVVDNDTTTFGAKKYKIWTFVLRIPDKTIRDKIEKIKKSFREVTELITVNSEVFNRQRMISVFFDNKEKMNTAKKINISADTTKPSYMHRAVIFKRNLQRNIMHGIKLWDISIGMKYKELVFEISSTFGDIERMNLRTNDMWQSAVIIFKEKNNAEKILENWNIIISDDSPLNFTAEMLKSRRKFTAKVIGLSIGITARELIPTIEKVKAKTCYFPKTRTSYRHKGETIVSFVSHEARNTALNTSWNDENITTTIKVVDFTTKTCHRYYSIEHLISNCPLTKRDAEFKEKKANSLEKFGAIYKKYNPRYLATIRIATLNIQTGNTTYVNVAKKNRFNKFAPIGDTNDRLSRIESLLLEVSERLTALEEHVWNKTNANFEQDLFDSDDDDDMDKDFVEQENSNPLININNNNNNNNSSINSNLSGNSNKTSEKMTMCVNANIVGISETNIKENGKKWFIEDSSKYRIHWSSMGRAITIDLVLLKKTIIRFIQMYFSNKKTKRVSLLNQVNNWCSEAKRKQYKLIIAGDFNAVPVPNLDRNNNNVTETPECEIFSSLTSKDLIDSYRILYPDQDNLEAITDSNHKWLDVKIKKNWRITRNKELIGNTANYKTLNKNWETFKNIITEVANRAMSKNKMLKRNKVVKKNTLKIFKIAKSINKIYRFVIVNKHKSFKWIQEQTKIVQEKTKLINFNYSIKKLFKENNSIPKLIDALRAESLHYQGIVRMKKKKETLQCIQKAIERR
ncbi:hypothetical protein Glove_130g203 [Diversispora epigaea]|uniref:Endonuclease/exonuclease/phosphatase domain-containing protein n=1 Tax=Diversispora epigaea TaxID=1348612 RepID=A0A397J7D9_9GLOM|nr:hypothetical protein Glove_130g203 [Diversispora epigaea]